MTRKLEPSPLPPGNWRLDPFTRIVRYVYDQPGIEQPDAFDEPYEPLPEPEPVMIGASGRRLKPIVHGQPAGSRAHARRGEPPCDDCRRAHVDYKRNLRLQRAAEGDPRYSCKCGAPKSRGAKLCDPCERRRRWSRTSTEEAA